MKVLVPIKRVIDYAIKVRVNKDCSGVEVNNIKHSMNPFCEIAVEQAVQLKEKKKAKEIIAFSIGPKQTADVLRTALALGADKAIHVKTDKRIDQEIQPLVVAKALKQIVERDSIDCVLLGKQSIDDDFNHTGQMLAGIMNWPQATFAYKMEVDGKECTVEREVDGGLQTLQFQLPGVITCDLRLNKPRFATLPNIMKAKKKPIEAIDLESLGIEVSNNIEVLKTEEPIKRAGGVKVADVDELISKLKDEAKLI